MGKSDEKQTKEVAHKAADDESKHKIQPSFDTLKPRFDAAAFEAIDKEGSRHCQWRELFRQLCEYKVQFGDCLVPRKYDANPKLGNWVSKQRTRYGKKTEESVSSMIAEHIRALNGIGFDWGARKTALESIWVLRFQQLCEYKEEFGHCLVPKQYLAKNKLGRWVSKQRNYYKLYQEGKPTIMSAERIRELESIGFKWGARKTVLESIWSLRFQQLCDFKEEFGHCLVSKQYCETPMLGQWISKQRSYYRLYREGKQSPITAERIRILESVDFRF
jgi:hypothetical protein